MIKSYLRWTGSKAKLLNNIIENMTKGCDRIVEPFGGSAVVSLNLAQDMPLGAVVTDLCQPLISTQQCVLMFPEEVITYLSRLTSGYNNSIDKPKYYAEIRKSFNTARFLSPIKGAAMFIFLNRTCFNGLWRVNKKGWFNVPHGDQNIPENLFDRIRENSRCFKSSMFLNVDYSAVLNQTRDNDFVYLDPPYLGTHTAYTEGGFSSKDYDVLLQYMLTTSSKVMLSHPYNEILDTVYNSDKIRIAEVETYRSISSKATTRGRKKELLIMNY